MEKLKLAIVPVTPFEQNCTLLWCPQTMQAAVIDPGGDLDRVHRMIAETKVTVAKIWLTHGHIDHVGGAMALKESLGAAIEGPHLADKFLLDQTSRAGARYEMFDARDVTPDRWLADGDSLEVGEVKFDVLHCPGHSPGSVAFVNALERLAIVGDVLFRRSVGRTDLPGGDAATLMTSIRNKLLPLGDDVTFICGHGPASTMGDERRHNPFLV